MNILRRFSKQLNFSTAMETQGWGIEKRETQINSLHVKRDKIIIYILYIIHTWQYLGILSK